MQETRKRNFLSSISLIITLSKNTLFNPSLWYHLIPALLIAVPGKERNKELSGDQRNMKKLWNVYTCGMSLAGGLRNGQFDLKFYNTVSH